MQPHIICLALCLAAAAGAAVPTDKVETVRPLSADLAMRVEQVKDMMTKGFFEDLAQVSQNIIQHAHMVAEQIIMSIDEAAHQALQNLQKDKPEAITLSPGVVSPAEAAQSAQSDAAQPAETDVRRRG